MICSSQTSTHCIPYFHKVSVVWSHWLNLTEKRNSVTIFCKVLEFGKCKPSLVLFSNFLISKFCKPIYIYLWYSFVRKVQTQLQILPIHPNLVGTTQLRSLPKFHNLRGCNPVEITPEVKLSKNANLCNDFWNDQVVDQPFEIAMLLNR